MEPIHVQLANKGGVIVVLEQFRDEGFGKLVLVKDNERVAIVRPSYQICVFTVL